MTTTEPQAVATVSPPAPTNGNLTGLVSGIVDDAQKLLRQQVEMLKAEVKEDFRRSKRAVSSLRVRCRSNSI